MKPLGLGKKIEALAEAAGLTPQEWLANYINEKGSISKAAGDLKVSRQALSNKCKQYDIKVSGVKREFSIGD